MVSSTRIKVSDLLLHVGGSDVVPFSGISLDTIPGLTAYGISGSLQLQSIDPSTIVATLENVVCSINDVSDVSGESYVRSVSIAHFTAYFALESDAVLFNVEDEASVFPIDAKNMLIDIADFLYEALVLQTPIVKRTPAEDRLYQDASIDDLDDFGDSSMGGQVVFRPIKRT